jgi:CubicO group peptidase (beta-lactamase class C family)
LAGSKALASIQGIDQCVESNMTRINAPGAAVAVILDGQLFYTTGYGVKRRGGNDRVDQNTVFRIGSVTKMMTAAAVMQQVELGRVDLDAPVTDYIPELEIGGRWPAERITVWHTLTHTTGFPDWITHLSLVGPVALSVWASDQGAVELHAPPGSFWNYSNPNFMLAGLVAERASGTPYRELFKQNLWERAGMHSTTFSPTEVLDAGNYSNGHYSPDTGGEIVVGPRDNDLWAAGPAGFAFSTVGDLVNWALLLMDGGGHVLSPSSSAAMQAPHQWTHYYPDLFYGYGVMVEDYNGLEVRQHGGNVAGYGTYLLWVPERRFAVALLANVTSSLTSAAYCIVDEVLEPEPVADPDLTTDPSTWDRYLGEYLFTDSQGESAHATVYFEGGLLMASIVDPDSGETFYTRLQQVFLDTFLYDSNGSGQIDNGDEEVTFCSRRGEPGFMMWLRNRYSVGERQLTPRAAGRATSP